MSGLLWWWNCGYFLITLEGWRGLSCAPHSSRNIRPPTAAPQPLRPARPKGRPRGWGLRGEDLDIIDVYEELDKGILV